MDYGLDLDLDLDLDFNPSHSLNMNQCCVSQYGIYTNYLEPLAQWFPTWGPQDL